MAKDKKNKSVTESKTEQIWKDPRFAHLVNDPRFKGIPKSEKKVKIDKRFESMFKDDKFKVKQTVDKYGRKANKSSSEDLKKYYDLSSEDEGEDETKKEEQAMVKDSADEDFEEPSVEIREKEHTSDVEKKLKSRLKNLDVDYARGEANILTDSSSDEESEEEEDEDLKFDHVWGEMDADAERTEESTRRLALCNMDWDRIRAVDIIVLCSSFLPPGSSINSVAIYPSEFGKARMEEEERIGPQELTKPTAEDEVTDSEEKQSEKLREYQLNRLKYYYAVVECNNVDTADKLYKECDGLEYESTANKLDLRFIPDDMEFDDKPKDIVTELPDFAKYVPRLFTTTALQQASVQLTWDENDLERQEFNEKISTGKLSQLSDVDLKKYVACSSDDDEESASDQEPEEKEEEEEIPTKGKKSKKESSINKYKALLSEIKEKEEQAKKDKIEMEFSWQVNQDNEDEDEGEEKDGRRDVNPFEKILEKHKDKKKNRKELKKKKKKRAGEDAGDEDESSDDDLPFGVNLDDPYFADAYAAGEFPDNKTKKKSKKNKKDVVEDADEEDAEEVARRKAELELLMDGDDEDTKSHFNLKKIQEDEIDFKTKSKSKRKRLLKKQIEASKSKIEDEFQINVEDNRFAAVYSKPEFNIDPTNPNFKKTKAMDTLIKEKLKKRPLDEVDLKHLSENTKKFKNDVATKMLIKSIKRKVGKGV